MSRYLIFHPDSERVVELAIDPSLAQYHYPVDSIMYDPVSADGPWFVLTQFTVPRVLAWDPIHVSEVPAEYRAKALLLL